MTAPDDGYGPHGSPLDPPWREDGWTPRGNANRLHLPSRGGNKNCSQTHAKLERTKNLHFRPVGSCGSSQRLRQAQGTEAIDERRLLAPCIGAGEIDVLPAQRRHMLEHLSGNDAPLPTE